MLKRFSKEISKTKTKQVKKLSLFRLLHWGKHLRQERSVCAKQICLKTFIRAVGKLHMGWFTAGIVLCSGEVSVSQLNRKCLSLWLASWRGTNSSNPQLIIYETKNGWLEGLCLVFQQVMAKGKRSLFGLVIGKQGSPISFLWESWERMHTESLI